VGERADKHLVSRHADPRGDLKTIRRVGEGAVERQERRLSAGHPQHLCTSDQTVRDKSRVKVVRLERTPGKRWIVCHSQVHFSILPGSVAKNRHLLGRTVA
jgi:hypothetical protein